MPLDFAFAVLPDAAVTDDLSCSMQRLSDVRAAVQAIDRRGTPFAVRADLPPATYTGEQAPGINDAVNHLQGVQRLARGKYLAFSGSFATKKRRGSHLFIAELGSRTARGPWGSNVLLGLKPSTRDTLVGTYLLSKDYWHPGGLALSGNLLAVPLEHDSKPYRIVFIDLTEPQAPAKLPDLTITSGKERKAGAVALIDQPMGGLLCAVWREVTRKPRGRIDLYRTTGASVGDGFEELPFAQLAIAKDSVPDGRDPEYQSITLLRGAGDDPAIVYLVGLENGAGTAPWGTGKNHLDLWRLDLDQPTLGNVASTTYTASSKYCNFDAAGGLYVSPAGELGLYSGYHWRWNGAFRFAEFVARTADGGVSGVSHWAEFFADEKHRGLRVPLYGERELSVNDFDKLFADDEHFRWRDGSVRFQLPVGSSLALYPEPGLAGNPTLLAGTGGVIEIEDLKERCGFRPGSVEIGTS